MSGLPHPDLEGHSECSPEGDEASVRRWALSEFVAQHPHQIGVFWRFREVWMAGEYIPRDQVEDWLLSQARESVPESDQAAREVLVKYRTPGGKATMMWAVIDRDSLIGHLSSAGRALSMGNRWLAEDATMYLIVDGYVPCIQTAQVQVAFNHRRPLMTRIELSVDPTMSPADVAKLYGRYRSALMPGRRFRPQEVKSMRLAVHGMRRDRDPALNSGPPNWKELMGQWNDAVKAEHPDWTYSDDVRFGNDCRESLKRLTSAPFDL